MNLDHEAIYKAYPNTTTVDDGRGAFDKDGNQIEVVSVQDNFLGTEATFYSLDVEDVDTYFSSDILVHNIPKK